MGQITINWYWEWGWATNVTIEDGDARVEESIAVVITVVIVTTAIAAIPIAIVTIAIAIIVMVSILITVTVPAFATLLITKVRLDVVEFICITRLGDETCNIRCFLLFIKFLPGWGFASIGFRFRARSVTCLLPVCAGFGKIGSGSCGNAWAILVWADDY